jgi:hypothetical protein
VNRICVPLDEPQKQSDLAWQLMWNDPIPADRPGMICKYRKKASQCKIYREKHVDKKDAQGKNIE